MRFVDVIRLALSNLKKRKGRTFLTSFAIAIGTMLIVTMVQLGTTAQNYVVNSIKQSTNAKKIDISPSNYIEPKKEDDETFDDYNTNNFKLINKEFLEKLSKFKDIDDESASIQVFVSSIKIGNISTKENGLINLKGYNLDYEIFMKNDMESETLKNKNFSPLLAGKILTSKDTNGVMISKGVIDSMNIIDYTSVIGKECTINIGLSNQRDGVKNREFKAIVVGVLSDVGENYTSGLVVSDILAANLKGYQQVENNYLITKGYDKVTIEVKTEDKVEGVIMQIKQFGYSYSSSVEMAKEIDGIFNAIKLLLALLGVIVLFVASLGVINTMTMSIYERTKSIGIMKSVGASNNNISTMFIVEAGCIGLIGGIMGVVFSIINCKIISFIMTLYISKVDKSTSVEINIPSYLIIGALIFSVTISILAGIHPSRKAAKLDPIIALNSK